VSHARIALICSAFTVIASFAVARIHPFGNAEIFASNDKASPILTHSEVPYAVRSILIEKCADCHSEQTNAPFYGRFAPISWLMERDVLEARKAMNLSQWDSYAPEQQQTLAAKIVHATKSHDMPPSQYRMIHWNARITDADLKAIARLAQSPDASLAQLSIAGQGDPVRGKELFQKRCTGCHALAENREGPKLQGVYGRNAGAVANFAYSMALKKARIIWDEKSLESWLTDPDAFLPGNDMDFLVSKPQDRQDLISYLKQSSGR
jgi:cytochrome c